MSARCTGAGGSRASGSTLRSPAAGRRTGCGAARSTCPASSGSGKAAEVAGEGIEAEAARLAALRDRLESTLLDRIDGVRVNGSVEHRLPNTTNLTFPGTRGKLLPAIRGIAASVGSACRTKSSRPSHVLTALGLDDEAAFSSLRLSLGRFTTEDEIDRAADEITAAVAQLRAEPTLA